MQHNKASVGRPLLRPRHEDMVRSAILTRVWVVLFLKSLTPDTNRLTTRVCPTTGKKLRRGFCRFVLGPISKIIRGCLDGSDKRRFLETYLCQQLDIELDIDHISDATEVMKRAMATLLPLPAVSALPPDSPQSWNFCSSLGVALIRRW